MLEEELVSEAVRRLDRDRWIPLTEFQIGIRESLGKEYQEVYAKQTRKRESPLSIDLLLVSREPFELDRDNNELEHYKEWKGEKYAYKVQFNPEAPEWEGDSKRIFLSEMGRLLTGREVMVVECKTVKLREGRGGLPQEYGPHRLFHGVGQVLLYYLLLKDDYREVRNVGTSLLTDEYQSVERSVFERMKEHSDLRTPPFDTRVWTPPLTDSEFFFPGSGPEHGLEDV